MFSRRPIPERSSALSGFAKSNVRKDSNPAGVLHDVDRASCCFSGKFLIKFDESFLWLAITYPRLLLAVELLEPSHVEIDKLISLRVDAYLLQAIARIVLGHLAMSAHTAHWPHA